LLDGCSSTKSVPAGDALYTGARITFKDNALSRKKKKAMKAELLALTRPKPNPKFPGLRLKLSIYNAFYKAKKWPGKWLRDQFGQPPVLLSSVSLDANVKVLNGHLQNKGYFNSRVRGDTTVKGKKATADYTVRTGNQYLVQQVQFKGDSSIVQQTVRDAMGKTLLKTNAPFDLDVITAERERIDNQLKEKGFYFFSPEFLLIKADTTIGNNRVNLFMTVKPAIPDRATRVYRINDVWLFTGYNLEPGQMDTSKAGATFYKGYYVVDKRHFYKPKLFQQSMTFNPGDVYNRTAQNASISRLINMNIFKFVKNRFEVVNSDSALLNTYYYLTRLPKKSLRFEVNGNTKSNNLTGSNVTLGWQNRNALRGGEIFSVKASAGFEIQYSGQFKGYNTFRYGIEPSLSFPRFLVPFINFNTKGGFLPHTTIKLGYDVLQRQKLYTMNSFRTSYGFTWKESIYKEHELNPISINYVQPVNITKEYIDSAKNDLTLYKAIDTQFILGSNYSYTYTNVLNYKPVNGFYLNAGIDLSGNIAGLATGANINKGDTAKIFGKQFSQYTRLQGDYRYYRKVGEKSVWANRIFAGIGIPYGNSRSLPYIKQFFAGGNNSIRAFRSRTVGPGTYQAPQVNGSLAEQPGDLKLELNTELRFPLAPSVLQGAVFVDAGNVWLWNNDPNKPGAQFSNKFLSEMAAGSGIGIRFDLSFLILRFDLAFPIRKPWLDPGKRWVINQIKFGDSEWRKENLILNLAIGYPF
jgi:outer membrane protein assembly factor BamA